METKNFGKKIRNAEKVDQLAKILFEKRCKLRDYYFSLRILNLYTIVGLLTKFDRHVIKFTGFTGQRYQHGV